MSSRPSAMQFGHATAVSSHAPGFATSIAIWLVRGLVATLAAGCSQGGPGAPASSSEDAPASSTASTTDDAVAASTAPAGAPVTALSTNDTVVGTGAEALPGSLVTVHYTGWLYDPAVADNKGMRFDSSRDGGQPFQFRIGAGDVIRGWDEGVAGMKVGGQRRLVIPAALGYGDRGAGGVIPPGASLLFEVELLAVESNPA